MSQCHPCHANERQCHQVPRLPRKVAPWATNGDQARHQSQPKWRGALGDERRPSVPPEPAECNKCHACHGNGTSMSPSATPATQSGAAPGATNGDQAHHQSQPSATSATPATPMERQCHEVPHLPCKRNVHQVQRLPRKVARRPGPLTATKRATRASQVQQVPRLPRKWNVNVTKCHACHANGTSMSPNATPATQSGAAPRATNGDQARHQSQPSATSATPAMQSGAAPWATNGDQARPPESADCNKCHACQTQVAVTSHACHANGTSMSPSATPARQSGAAPRKTNGDPRASQVQQVPCLPRKWNGNVTKRHACHANGTSRTRSALPATQSCVCV